MVSVNVLSGVTDIKPLDSEDFLGPHGLAIARELAAEGWATGCLEYLRVISPDILRFCAAAKEAIAI